MSGEAKMMGGDMPVHVKYYPLNNVLVNFLLLTISDNV